ncbi:MAG TPA: hypothetical protein ENH10_07275 [Bacteroidetes bacterium]|nr:Y_Y_Y domain protein [bacterium BMS3Bbin04]HDO65813.1 hypothetical protein [Bacteroidota bacterium]HEX04938.1 hypothetical protein [Bacteroidota bacterium]
MLWSCLVSAAQLFVSFGVLLAGTALFRPTNISLSLTLLLLLGGSAFSALPDVELGLPYITSFVPDDYGGMGQNWGITQADNGLMYVANGKGVFEYDGVDWNWLEEDQNRTARSIAAGPGHIIYVGYYNDVGYFKADSIGTMTYTSLIPQISDSLQVFRDVWATLVHDNYVYFNPVGHLFRWEIDENGPIEGTLLEIVLEEERFQALTAIDDEIYVIISERGIFKMVGEELELLPGSNYYELLPVWSILPYPGNKLLLVGYNGMLIYDGSEVVEWDSEASEYCAATGSYNASDLGNGYYALGTSNDGVALFDTTGSVLRIINRDLGIPNNQVLAYPYLDNEGGIWVCLEYGLARVNLISELQRYNYELGLEGGAMVVRRYKDDLYVATSQGLYRLNENPEPGRPVTFSKIGSLSYCWGLSEVADQLLSIGDGSVQAIREKGGEPEVIGDGLIPFSITADTTFNRVFIGNSGGLLTTFIFRDDEWHDEGQLHDFGKNVVMLTPARDGAIWVNYGFDKLSLARLSVNQDGNSIELSDIQIFSDELGHFENSFGSPFYWQDELLILGEKDLYRYDAETRKLVTADDQNIYELAIEKEPVIATNAVDGSLWFEDIEGVCNHLIPLDGGGYELETPLRRNAKTGYNSFYIENGTLWAGLVGSDLIRYDMNKESDFDFSNQTLIRSVRTGTDSLLFRGAENTVSMIDSPLDWSNRTVRISYALPSFDDITRNEYQVRLIGLSNVWSDWTDDTSQLYNNLSRGQYRFEVRGRDVCNIISETGTIEFIVSSPWYATWWAVTIWIFVAISMVYTAIQRRLQAIENRNRLLDKKIRERTAQVEALLIKEQESAIKATQMETAYKMAATIAHEFNNPLAIIQASSQLIAKDVFKEQKLREFAEMIPPQVSRLKYLLQRITTIEELREIDYAAGMKILDIHDGKAPNGRVVPPKPETLPNPDTGAKQQE